MAIQHLEDIIASWDEDCQAKRKRKRKYTLHKYDKRKLSQKKLKELYNQTRRQWCAVMACEGYYKRCYIGSRTSFLKKQSNKMVRKYRGDLPPKGNGYRRLYDYWWAVF